MLGAAVALAKKRLAGQVGGEGAGAASSSSCGPAESKSSPFVSHNGGALGHGTGEDCSGSVCLGAHEAIDVTPLHSVRRPRRSSLSSPAVLSEAEADDDGSSGSGAREAKRARFLARHCSDPLVDLLDPPQHDVWWRDVITNGARDAIDDCSRKGLRRKVRLLSVCSGIGSELYVVKTMGLPVAHNVVCCDSDAVARRFISKNHKDLISHIFCDMHALGSSGACEEHGCDCCDDSGEIDVIIGGPPCTPYSRQRSNRGDVPVEKHRAWAATFGCGQGAEMGFLGVLQKKMPKCGAFENVMGFGSATTADGSSPLALFIAKLQSLTDSTGKQLYSGYKVLKLDPLPFLDMPRPRRL